MPNPRDRINQFVGIGRSAMIYYARPFLNRRMRQFYSQFIKPGDTAFDVGSHLGNRIRPWRQLGAQVVALEPEQTLFRLLKRFYGGDPQVHLINSAVGERAGRGQLAVCPKHPTLHTLAVDWRQEVMADPRFQVAQWSSQQSVAITDLNELQQKYGEPAFCKIDVEGWELEVLKGLKRPLPVISFEYIPVVINKAIECIQRLESLGSYVYNTSTTETMRFQHQKWLNHHQLIDRLSSLPTHAPSGDVYAKRK